MVLPSATGKRVTIKSRSPLDGRPLDGACRLAMSQIMTGISERRGGDTPCSHGVTETWVRPGSPLSRDSCDLPDQRATSLAIVLRNVPHQLPSGITEARERRELVPEEYVRGDVLRVGEQACRGLGAEQHGPFIE